MNTPPPNLVGTVERAAELRAAGQSWELVAQTIHRKVSTIRNWPTRYREFWNQVLAEARRISVESAGDEARAFLRIHLRSKTDASLRDAAKQLIHHQTTFAKTETPEPPSEIHRFVEVLEGMSDAELDSLLEAVENAGKERSLFDLPPGRAIRRARRDPNAFVSLCFSDPSGQPLRQAAVHKDLQQFLSRHRKAVVELPRDHGKSTQICARLVWELGRDPSLRIKIVCASEALAAERGRFIREAIDESDKLKLVFPQLHADRPWSDTRLTIVRPANVIGPSITAIGIGAASTGSRADLLVCDDIVDVKSLYSPAERARVKEHFRNNLMNLLEPDGRFWGLCTPWHLDDLNAELKRSEAYALFRRAIGDDLTPVWPERWTRELLAARRGEIGDASFSRGYKLVPLADDTLAIALEKVQYWTVPIEPDRVILSIDPAVSINPRADFSAFVVLAKFGEEIRCLDAQARRVAAPDLLNLIAAFDTLWNPEAIVFESNAAFEGIADLMERHASFGAKVRKVKNSKDKGARISAFSVSVVNGSFKLKGDGSGRVDPSQQPLLDEMITFPVGEHDDLLDAAATGTAYLLGKREARAW